jgi:hypothetical protein
MSLLEQRMNRPKWVESNGEGEGEGDDKERRGGQRVTDKGLEEQPGHV